MENASASQLKPDGVGPPISGVWMWVAAGVVVVTAAQTGFILYLCKKCSTLKTRLQQVSNECVVLGQEIRQLREAIREVREASIGRPYPAGSNSNSKQRVGNYKKLNSETQSNSTPRRDDVERGVRFYEPAASQLASSSESSDYTDAVDEWTAPLLFVNSSASTSASHSPAGLPPNYPSANERTTTASTLHSREAGFDQIDSLHQSGQTGLEYSELKKLNDDSSSPNGGDVEILWRLARVCRSMSSMLDPKDQKRKELLFEGQEYALKAYRLDDANFNVVKWTAVLSGALTDYLGMKEKIQQGYLFKQYLDKALEMDPNEYSLLHMRGRFAFSVASLSWIERKAAATFFAAPPSATFEEAIADFLKVEEIRPQQWVENMLYLAKSYLAVKDKENALRFLKIAAQTEPSDEADKEAKEEVKALLQKHSR